MTKLVLLVFMTFTVSASALTSRPLVKVNVIGSSGKGQYIAFEEFGYKLGKSLPFAKIRILNVWTNKYIKNSYEVVKKGTTLLEVRKKVRSMATETLKKFHISS